MKMAIVRDGIVENVIVPPEGEWDAPEGVELIECADGAFVGPGFTYDGQDFVAPVIVPPVPEEVTMRQAQLALLQYGLIGAVEEVIASLPSPQREAAEIEWKRGAVVRRDAPLITMLMPLLKLTEEQIDDLFRLAASL